VECWDNEVIQFLVMYVINPSSSVSVDSQADTDSSTGQPKTPQGPQAALLSKKEEKENPLLNIKSLFGSQGQ